MQTVNTFMGTIYSKLLGILFSLVIFQTTLSQSIDTKLIDEENHFFITRNVDVLKSISLIPFDSVLLSVHQIGFKEMEDIPVVFAGYDQYYYWFRFSIANRDTIRNNLVLLLGPLGMRDAELFQGNHSSWKSLGKTGNRYAFIDRPYQYTHYAYPLTLEPSTLDTFYLYVDWGHEFRNYAFVLMQAKAMKALANKVYLSFGIIIGLLLLFLLFNLYLFFALKEKLHFWYGLYVVFVLAVLMKNDGLDEQFLHLDSETAYRATSIMAFAAFGIGLLMIAVQLFLDNLKETLWYKATALIKKILFVSAACQWFVFYFQPGLGIEEIVFNWTRYSTAIALVMILLNAACSFFKGFKSALWILAGLTIFFVGCIERLLTISTPSYLFPPSTFHLGMVLETIIISFGLSYRFKTEREHINQRILEVQDEEQERFAKDLHAATGVFLNTLKIKQANTSKGTILTASQCKDHNERVEQIKDVTRRIAHSLAPPRFEETALEKIISDDIVQLNKASDIKFRFYFRDYLLPEKVTKSSINQFFKRIEKYFSKHFPEFYSYRTGVDRLFSKRDRLMIYRIFQELISNVVNHSEATEVSVQLQYGKKDLQMIVEDNGKGITEAKKGKGMGLKNIQARVSYLKGSINIDSGVKGTTVITEIPYR